MRQEGLSGDEREQEKGVAPAVSLRAGIVRRIDAVDFPLQFCHVELDAASPLRLACHDLASASPLAVGDRVWLNVTATELGLGSGGVDWVVWSERHPRHQPVRMSRDHGHIMKVRYTPVQRRVLTIEESAHPLHAAYRRQETLGLEGRCVIALGLHSQLPAVLSGLRTAADPPPAVGYVHTDATALPVAYSRVVRSLRAMAWLQAVVSCGHAYGGDVEAVSIPSGLLAAAAAGADVIVAGGGPGTVGTGTTFGTSVVQQLDVLHWAHQLGGKPVFALRLSDADPRARHRNISHHARTLLRYSLVPLTLVLPDALFERFQPQLARQAPRHRIERAAVEDGRRLLLEAFPDLTSMGRTPAQDPWLFDAAVAAGAWVARRLWQS